MANHLSWHDPLLITDVPHQQNQHNYVQYLLAESRSSQTLTMEDPDDSCPNKINDKSCGNENIEGKSAEDFSDPIADNVFDGQPTLGISLTSPNLVICTGSPDIPKPSYADSPKFLKGASIELSLENGIEGSEIKDSSETPAATKMLSLWQPSKEELSSEESLWQPSKEELSSEESFELLPPAVIEEKSEYSIPVTSSNSGSIDGMVVSNGTEFLEDSSFSGGDVIRADTQIGDEEGAEENELLKVEELSQVPQDDTPTVEEGFRKLQVECYSQKKELIATNKVLEALKMENERKSRECEAAQKSLQDLQNELMRKSMHVGSLAFAVEGQVKEKSRWFSSLRDMTRKLKIMKMEQIELSEEALSYKKCMEDMTNVTSMIQSRVNQEVKLHDDLKIKFNSGARERKELYNKILELKGNIRVFCRCRPLNSEEHAEGASMAFDFEAAKDGELIVKSNGSFKKSFKFDAVFSPQANQVDVFEDTAPFATSVLDGYNVCIFAYGQTGTGKTYTMEGTDESRGVNFRTLDELFRVIDERKNQVRYEINVSVMEVYNEQIRDLLAPSSQPGVTVKRLEIRQVAEGVHHVPGLVEAHVNNMNEVWDVLRTGSNARAVGSTNANEHSSRSHCVHCVMVKGENLLNGECTRSKLWLVDLAGSERVAKTEVQGERLKETQNINRSLSALGDVISALATKSPHVPFRNSKLTHLLQDSLGRDSKTLMFVQISPNEDDLSESLCSLNFASRVRGIELGPAKKQLDSIELLKYKQMVEKTKHEMKSKDMQMKKMEDTVHGLEIKVKERDLKNKSLQDKVKELESQLLIERKLARQHVDTKIAEQHQQMRQHQEDVITRPPLVSLPLGTHKNFNEGKGQANIAQPFSENNPYKVSTALAPIFKHNDTSEKENNPDLIKQLQLPKQTGRASICTTAQRIITPLTSTSAPRRNSLIPLPKFLPQLLPLAPIQDDKREDDKENGFPEATAGDSPKESDSGGIKKANSLLRKSIQKKIQMKSPMQQHIRRGGVNVEKVRVSIGGRGRMGYRGTFGSGRKVARGDNLQKPNPRDKERRWNTGNGGRTLV